MGMSQIFEHELSCMKKRGGTSQAGFASSQVKFLTWHAMEQIGDKELHLKRLGVGPHATS